jgi:hypothetical protein
MLTTVRFARISAMSGVRDCPATQEAVLEAEGYGEAGCPLCGGPWDLHAPESETEDETEPETEDEIVLELDDDEA